MSLYRKVTLNEFVRTTIDDLCEFNQFWMLRVPKATKLSEDEWRDRFSAFLRTYEGHVHEEKTDDEA